jgi:hypothetical protein
LSTSIPIAFPCREGLCDGSAKDLLAVVNHYDQLFALHLTAAQKADLVEFLKSL